MSFISINYLIFFPAVVLLYYLLPKKIRMYWLLIASYYFICHGMQNTDFLSLHPRL